MFNRIAVAVLALGFLAPGAALAQDNEQVTCRAGGKKQVTLVFSEFKLRPLLNAPFDIIEQTCALGLERPSYLLPEIFGKVDFNGQSAARSAFDKFREVAALKEDLGLTDEQVLGVIRRIQSVIKDAESTSASSTAPAGTTGGTPTFDESVKKK